MCSRKSTSIFADSTGIWAGPTLTRKIFTYSAFGRISTAYSVKRSQRPLRLDPARARWLGGLVSVRSVDEFEQTFRAFAPRCLESARRRRPRGLRHWAEDPPRGGCHSKGERETGRARLASHEYARR